MCVCVSVTAGGPGRCTMKKYARSLDMGKKELVDVEHVLMVSVNSCDAGLLQVRVLLSNKVSLENQS
jgi:hypothetical protein